jgi:hypothetical protein
MLIQISIRQINFQYKFSQLLKVQSFEETFTPYNQILIFEEQLFMPNINFYI